MTTEPDLARLILDAKGDRSYERMSTDCGGTPTDKRLQQLATTALKSFPDAATMRGLARGTGTTETAVVLAAARSLGLRVRAADDPDALVLGGAVELRAEQKDALFALVRVFREMNAEAAIRGLETEIAASKQRLEATTDLLAKLPIDGPSRAVERAIVVRTAIEAREALEAAAQQIPTAIIPAGIHNRLGGLRYKWDVIVKDLVKMAAKYPPFSSEEEVTTHNLNRVIHSTGSGKSEVLVLAELDEYRPAKTPRPRDLVEAAYDSPEAAGQPEPEHP